MKTFIVETDDNNATAENLREALYHSSTRGYTIKEVHDEEGRMTFAQRERLVQMCKNYNVPFREDDYHPSFGMYEGWIGGRMGTIYVGVEKNGRSHT